MNGIASGAGQPGHVGNADVALALTDDQTWLAQVAPAVLVAEIATHGNAASVDVYDHPVGSLALLQMPKRMIVCLTSDATAAVVTAAESAAAVVGLDVYVSVETDE